MIPPAPRTNSVGACVAETDACCPGSGAVTLGGGWFVSIGAITIGFVVAVLTAADDAAFFAADMRAFLNLLNFSFKRFNFLYLAASNKRGCCNNCGVDDTAEFALFPSLLLVMKSSSLSSEEEEEEDESEEEDETLGKTFPRDDEDDDDDDVIPDVDAEFDEDEADPVVGADDDDDDNACRIVGESGIAMLFVCTVAGQLDTAGLTATEGCGVDAMCAIGGCAPI